MNVAKRPKGSVVMYNPYLGSSSDDSIIFVIMILYFSIFAIMFAVGITGYILKGLGLYRMGQRRNISYAWLAWIPIASNFLFGKLAGEVDLGNRKIKNTGLWMLLFPLIVFAICIVFFVVLFIITLSAGIISHQTDSVFAIGGIFPLYMIFILVLSIISIIMNIFYGLVYWTYFSHIKPNSTSLFYTMLGLFVPLALQINLFRVRDLPIDGMEQAQSSTPAL